MFIATDHPALCVAADQHALWLNLVHCFRWGRGGVYVSDFLNLNGSFAISLILQFPNSDIS